MERGELYRSKTVRIIRKMLESDRYIIQYKITTAFNPDNLELTYVYKDPWEENAQWTYMMPGEFENWQLMELKP